MKCEDFGRYIDNYESLTAQERNEMYKHAEVCGKCQAELDFFLSMIATAKSLPKIEPPSDFMSSLNARLDKEDKRVVSMSRLANHLRRYRMQYAAAAACLALVAAITVNRSALLDRMNNDGSGVISEETVATDTTGGQSAGTDSTPSADENETTVTETVTETVPEAVTSKGEAAAAPAAVQATPASAPRTSGGNSVPAKTSSSAVTAAKSSPAAETAVQTPAASAPSTAVQPVQTETAGSEASRPAETKESSGNPKEDYGIALAGVINTQTETAAVTYDLRAEEVKASLQASEIKANYSLADGGESIAYGRYYTLDRNGNPISSATGIGSIKISSADADKAMDVLNRYPVDENGEVYTTDSVNLTRILSKLRSEGISYTDYTISGSGEVKFKVIFN